jgi:hypothetical protein
MPSGAPLVDEIKSQLLPTNCPDQIPNHRRHCVRKIASESRFQSVHLTAQIPTASEWFTITYFPLGFRLARGPTAARQEEQ